MNKKEECLDEIIAWARSRKEHIEHDSRFKAKPADIEINAPLALIQVAMETEHQCLNAVLKIARGEYDVDEKT